MLLFRLFYKWGNWGSEVNLPKAIGLVGKVPVFGAGMANYDGINPLLPQ